VVRRWERISTGRAWIAIDNDRSSFCHGLRHEADRPRPRELRIAGGSRRVRICILELAILGDSAGSREAVERVGPVRVSRVGRLAAGGVGSRFRGRSGDQDRRGVVDTRLQMPLALAQGGTGERAVCGKAALLSVG
jgi:hypothetical protein